MNPTLWTAEGRCIVSPWALRRRRRDEDNKREAQHDGDGDGNTGETGS